MEGSNSKVNEAIKYIKAFRGCIFVIKLGGEIVLDEELIQAITREVVLLHEAGIYPIILHGGGPAITETMEKLGKKPVFINGLRFTDEETMEVVKMVLLGKINMEIVARLNNLGAKAVNLSGKSANLFIAEKYKPEGRDLGQVGRIVQINTDLIHLLLKHNYIPVVAPIALGDNGSSFNINADTAAAELAIAVNARKLIILTNVDGVKDKSGALISELSSVKAEKLIEEGVISGGMIPKVKACLRAIDGGVERCHIIKASPESLLQEVFTDEGKGTMFTGEREKNAGS